MSRPISRFNPQRMSEDEVLSLATGRENLLKLMIDDMQTCMYPNSNQHFILYGPRGIGKSFFTRLLKITHDRSTDFKKSIFIQLPEEQSNLSFVADLIDMVSTKLEGKLFDSIINRWEITDNEWQKSKKRLLKATQDLKKIDGIEHVFFTMENLQDFIPKLSAQENGRMRELLSDFSNITLIGSSLHPDLDNDYSKKLFQVFKKIDLKPWGEKDYITYYRKKAEFKGIKPLDEEKTKLSEHRIRAIANFTGGSPRLAVILNSLILNDDILSTLEIMNGIIDELTPYYQDLTKDIPPRSKILFDSLIRMGENITQSQLAAGLQPPQEQKTIAKSFSWLTDNFYVNAIKQKTGNVKHYYVRDRLYVLYYQNREIMADQKYSFVETFVEFLTDFYNQQELKDHLQRIDDNHFLSKELLFAYIKKIGIELDEKCSLLQLKEAIINYEGSEYDFSHINSLINDKKFVEVIEIYKKLKEIKRDYNYFLNLGMLNGIIENHMEAIKYFKEAIKLDPKSSEAYYNIGVVYFKNKDFDLAIKNYKKCIDLNPKESDVYYQLGKAYTEINYFEDGIKYFLKSLEVEPKNSNVYAEIGINYYSLRKYNVSIKFLKKAIKLDSSLWVYHFALGSSLNQMGKYTLALKSLNKAIELNPSEGIIYIHIGNSYFFLNDYIKAEKNLLFGFELEPYNFEIQENIVQFYLSINEYDKITKLLSNYRNEQNYGSIIAKQLLELLSKNRSENFHQIMKTLTWIESDNENWLLHFTSSLTSALYVRNESELLADFIGELQQQVKFNSSLQVFLQAWQYILAPEKGDLAALHPDARIAAQAILEIKKE